MKRLTILNQLEVLRTALVQQALEKGFLDRSVLKVSQQLDLLLNEYQKLYNQKSIEP
jgi:hypothetical protein